METKKELVVTFRLDASDYVDEGEVSALAFARQDAYDLIFKRAELNVLETLMSASVGHHLSGNANMDQLFRDCLKKELQAIRAAAETASYEIIEVEEAG